MAKITNDLYIQQVKGESPVDAVKSPQIQTSPAVAGARKLQQLANSASMRRDSERKVMNLQDKVTSLSLKADSIEMSNEIAQTNFLLKGAKLAQDIYFKYEAQQAQELINQFQQDLTEVTANELMNVNIKPSDTLETIMQKIAQPYKDLEATYKDILFSSYSPHTAKQVWSQMQNISTQISNSRILESARSIKNQREALGILGINSKITKEYVSGLEDLISKGASEEMIDTYTAQFNKQIQQKVADGIIPINIANKLRDTLGYHRQYYKNFGDVLSHTSNVLTVSSGLKKLDTLPASIRQQKLVKFIGSKVFKSLPIKERRKFLKQIKYKLRKTKGELYNKATHNIASQMAYAIANGQISDIPDNAWELVAKSKKSSASLSKMLSTAMNVYITNNPDMSVEELKSYYNTLKNKIVKYYGKSPKADMYKTLLYLDKNFSSNVTKKLTKVRDIIKNIKRDGVVDGRELNQIMKYKNFLPSKFKQQIEQINNLVSFVEQGANNIDKLTDADFETFNQLIEKPEIKKLVGNKVINTVKNTVAEALITKNPKNTIKFLNRLNQSHTLHQIVNSSTKKVPDKDLINLVDLGEQIKITNPEAYRTIKTSIGVSRYNKLRALNSIIKEKQIPLVDAQDYYDKIKIDKNKIVSFARKNNISLDKAEDLIRQGKLVGKNPESLLNQTTKSLTKNIRINTENLPPFLVDRVDEAISKNKKKIPESAKQVHIVNSNKGTIGVFTNELGLPIRDSKNPKNPLYVKINTSKSDPDLTTKTLDAINKTKKEAEQAVKKLKTITNNILKNIKINLDENTNSKDDKFAIPKLK